MTELASKSVELGKYMVVELVEKKPKTLVWKVYAKSSYHAELGTIKWFAPWRQYCFFIEFPKPSLETVDTSFIFNHSCLNQIRLFLLLQNKDHAEGLQP